ncbi:hypothetical protein ACOR62_06095 [Neisseria lisongii]|uniref:Uncharacterized protein n=1 Tax=Neisseria lisongii TaxID=2912188 RepID=A0AAW5AFD0_9NEIS|nr:hypothetical protein [Neisseria lisongii]MCF7528807.1 hypothetical protein [Neisseria lisongii]MCF7529665.1 hypothetical protein [Neisseria lisongii]
MAFRENSTSNTRILSKDGFENLEKTKKMLDNVAIDLHSPNWDYGGKKSSSATNWIFVNAYFAIPDCIDYFSFKNIMKNNGFKTGYGGTSYFCSGDVSIHSITSKSQRPDWTTQGVRSLMCENISFTLSWRKDENIEQEYCW